MALRRGRLDGIGRGLLRQLDGRVVLASIETEQFWAQPHRRFDSHRDAKLAVFDYLKVFYNRQRRHTSIGGIPPVTFESRHAETHCLAA